MGWNIGSGYFIAAQARRGLDCFNLLQVGERGPIVTCKRRDETVHFVSREASALRQRRREQVLDVVRGGRKAVEEQASREVGLDVVLKLRRNITQG